MKSRIVLICAAVAMLASCVGFHKPELVEIKELLPVDADEVIVDAAGGKAGLSFYATSEVLVEVLNDTGDWGTMTSQTTFAGDGRVEVEFTRNNSYRRMMMVRLTLVDKDMEDTLYFKQRGSVEPYLGCDSPFSVVDGTQDGKVSITLNTTIARDDLNVEVSYLEGETGWIGDLAFTGDIAWDNDDFAFQTKASTTTGTSRAMVNVWFDDGWKEDISVKLYLTRTGRNGELGTRLSFPELRARTPGEPFAAGEYIEGYVISDCTNLNMAENTNTAYDKIDLSVNDRTAYMQAEDGSCGVRLVFEEAEHNVLRHGMKVSLTLDGVQLSRKASPECYTISGVRNSNLLKVENGPGIEPKQLSLAELSPEHIYTYVKLTDLEFVNKDGAFTNIHEAFDYFGTWGSLLADNTGRGIMASFNYTLDWRRMGNGVPQGSGSVTGIIVSEDLKRLGNAGDCQIRVSDANALDMGEPSAYSTLAMWNGTKKTSYALSAQIPAVAGVGTLTTEIPASAAHTSASTPIRPVGDFLSRTTTGNGILLNKGLGFLVNLQGWYRFNGRELAKDEDTGLFSADAFNGLKMTLDLPQTGVSGLSCYISFLSWGINGFYRVAPAHWCLEFYDTDAQKYVNVPSAVTGLPYVHLRPGPCGEDYHNGRKYYPSTSMAAGFCDNLFTFPSGVLDQETLTVRFRPYDDVLIDFPAEPSLFDEDIESNRVIPESDYDGDIHFAEISFRTIR